jgi:hypothetical protein
METSELFKQQGFVLIKNAVHESLVSAVSKYDLLKEQYAFSADEKQVVGAHAVYSDFLMESLLIDYKPIVEWATGLKLLPTYSFYRVYRRGQELEPHVDRNSCEISISVCYEFDYKGKQYDWPLFMNGAALIMEPGDMAVYRGMDIEHWRPVFDVPQDSYHVQCFYHYVDADGPNAEYAYDRNNFSHLKLIEEL